MKKLVLLVFLASLLSSACEKSPVSFPVSKKQSQLIDANNAFGFELLKQVNNVEGVNKNLFISPLSVSMALSMTMNGAKGSTLDGMKSALQTPALSMQEINDINKYLLDNLVSLDPKVALTIANSIWYRNDFSVLPDFLNVNQNYYYAQVSPLNFADAENSKNTINQWVSDNTNKKIPTIIDQITGDNVMFLINAIYFKGNWKQKFDKNKTSDKEFVNAKGDKKDIPFMSQKITADYLSNNDFQLLELPYGRENYSMLIMLPQSGKSVNDLIGMLNPTDWQSWMNEMSQTKDVNVLLPKFKFEYELTMNDVLKSMGMELAFSDAADFTGINPGGNLYISEVKHKSFVEVNEEGTEAAAATSVGISLTSVPAEVWFIANKPFLFFITEKNTKSILFTGKITNP